MAETGRRLRFTEDFDWKPSPSVTMAYRKGQVAFVPLACAERAISLGRAALVNLPAPPAGIEDTIKRTGRRRARSRRKGKTEDGE